jgi:beta-lactamase class D
VIFRLILPIGLMISPGAGDAPGAAARQVAGAVQSCFLLVELGVGELRREPSQACRVRATPASTFKVPHAIAALEAGVVSGPDEKMTYDGAGNWPELSRRDHTLATAMRYSVVWYFQRLAERLGSRRETEYLRKLSYGNMDASSALTTFWLGGSLLISPEEQLEFWERLYRDRLLVSAATAKTVREMLIQPRGVVVNAMGEHAFDQPWPADVVVSAKTGAATDRTGQGVRWLAGHVARGPRAFVFVSCVIGPPDLDGNAAIDLAARALREAGVL